MKITAIRCRAVAAPMKRPLATSTGALTAAMLLLIDLETDAGVVGRSYLFSPGKHALSAIGRDRPGIVADLAELIYECDGNLEDSSMIILGSEFAVLLLLSGEGGWGPRRSSSPC